MTFDPGSVYEFGGQRWVLESDYRRATQSRQQEQHRAVHPATAMRCAKDAAGGLLILSGDVVGPSDSTWQDVAGTAAVNLRVLATYLEHAQLGIAANESITTLADIMRETLNEEATQ